MQESHSAPTPGFFSFWPAKLIAAAALFFALVQAEFALALPAAGVLLIGFAADMWARRAASRLQFSLNPGGDRVFPGENIDLAIELYNMKLLPVWLTLELPLPRHLEAEEDSGQPGLLSSGLRLLSWEKSRRVLKLTAKTRGVSHIGPARISAGDLLGLSCRTHELAGPREIIVFPRRLRMKALSVPFQEYFGAHAARGPVEDPAWYAGTRDYTGTRPAKSIHWKASARLGVLQEKICEPTLHHKMLFILDAEGWAANSGETSPDFERMLETLGTLAAALMETGASFGFVTNAALENSSRRILPAGRGPEHLGSMLEILARAAGKSASGIEEALREAASGYAGFVYCGSAAGEHSRRVCQGISGRKKIFCVFGQADTQGDESWIWEGFPACRMEDICFTGEDPQ
ncbi:MAG: DUF58 domain-containing protein [Spirochaetales bacterium]|jgi:uncharacterized protein (DUF58 family)|nr:DUF58 domain-containing protein [Spirochaetales bacterium]